MGLYSSIFGDSRKAQHGSFPFNSYFALCFPLQAVSGSGSRWTRPSKCCRATSRSMPSTCGGSSSAAPRPTETPSSRAHRRTTTTPITVPPPPPPRRAPCWAPPADRTAPEPHILSSVDRKSVQSCMNLMTFSEFAAILYVYFLFLEDGTHQSHHQKCVKRLVTEREKSLTEKKKDKTKKNCGYSYCKNTFCFAGKD